MSPIGTDDSVSIELVGPDNLSDCGIGCVANRRHPGFAPKVDWLGERFDEGLRFLLVRDEAGKALAFLEFVPGEHAWRPVDAAGWLFVHCLWVYPAGQKVGGLGSRLVLRCVEEADRVGAVGVAALTSAGPWMAPKEIFLRNGFAVVDERDRFQLVARRRAEGPEPRFQELDPRWSSDRGLHVVYAPQCPYVPKSVEDMEGVADEAGVRFRKTELRSAREAQAAPSWYGVFNLLWNGRVLSDHYVSATRFRSLIRREAAAEGR